MATDEAFLLQDLGQGLELQVTAREARDYDRFLEQLEASPRFAELAPGPENREGELRSSLGLRYVPEPRP